MSTLHLVGARQTSAAVEGINNKARVISKRAFGLKSPKRLWDRLILDWNRASEVIGYSIDRIRQIAWGLRTFVDGSCTQERKSPHQPTCIDGRSGR
jgi:hypothetical protein